MKRISLRLSAGLMAGFWTFYALAVSPVSVASTAWHDGRFHIDVPGVLHRSDIFLAGVPTPMPAKLCLWGMAASELRCGLRVG